jgi:hypothetical protein
MFDYKKLMSQVTDMSTLTAIELSDSARRQTTKVVDTYVTEGVHKDAVKKIVAFQFNMVDVMATNFDKVVTSVRESSLGKA